ncbi:unnamed protein product [Staurois parvus]|uniref:Uncharacterized protein n=1 Tax=Staurois parvus TaxID=386267 RepID=A0ABN9E7Q9_9NEOB|nr:unnamed protein product [Staurois parvus]
MCANEAAVMGTDEEALVGGTEEALMTDEEALVGGTDGTGIDRHH